MRLRLALIATTAFLVCTPFSIAQNKTRNVDRARWLSYGNQPIKLVSCEINGRSFSDCDGISAGVEWWRQLTLRVQNVSRKTISNIEVNFVIDKNAQLKTMTSIPLRVQKLHEPLFDDRGNPSGKTGLRIRPDEIFDLRINEGMAAVWAKHLEGFGATDIERLVLEIRSSYFDDGSSWTFGKWKDASTEAPHGKTITVRKLTNEPVKITSMFSNGMQISDGQSFDGGPDWLKGLVLKLQNISDRTISHVLLYVVAHETTPTTPPHAFRIEYGNHPGAKPIEFEAAEPVPTKGIFEAVLKAEEYAMMQKILGYGEDLADRPRAEIRLSEVYFADGIKWQGGSLYKPNPADPMRYSPLP